MATFEFSLIGKFAIVTGAASKVGQAIARGLAKEGATVILTDADREKGACAAQSLAAPVIPADLSSAEDIDRLVTQVLAEYGKIDILVNAAKYTPTASALQVTRQQWNTCFITNLDNAFFLSQAGAQHMCTAKSGSIIFVTDSDGHRVSWANTRAVACAASGAVVMLTKVLAAEWTPCGVRVNAILTGISEEDCCDDAAGKQRREEHLRFTPLGELASPDDFVGTAVYLASDASSYTTGHALIVDGGHHAY